MKNSAAPSRTSLESVSGATPFSPSDGGVDVADVPPMCWAWTDELERRRKAVARWRGDDAIKATRRK